jgi:hypothetical protein
MSSLHITGPCQAAYARGCRCNDCRKAWAEGTRRRRNTRPSPLSMKPTGYAPSSTPPKCTSTRYAKKTRPFTAA